MKNECVSASSVSLASGILTMQAMDGENITSRCIFGASVFLAGFSAMAFGTRLFYRGSEDGFILMNDVEQ